MTFLNEIFEEEPGQICESELVPLSVVYESDKVTVTSPKDDVNTGIAALDCFVMSDEQEKNIQSNLLVVDSGTTVYDVEYTDFKLGMIASVMGVAGCCLFWSILFGLRKEGGRK